MAFGFVTSAPISAGQSKRLLSTSLATALFSFSSLSWAQSDASIPAHIFTRDAENRTSILVDKKGKTAYLIDFQNDMPTLSRRYDNLLFGENDGDKEYEGDKRTPEGVYRITHFIPGETLPPLYGTGAFPIDYPNPLDRIEGRNGSGIWLHGKDDNDPSKNVTLGCVAFDNTEITELNGMIGKGTNVVIAPKADFLTPEAYAKERDKILQELDTFITSWEGGDIDTLASMLHPAFQGPGGIKRQAWLERKRRLAELYPEKRIATNNVYAYREDGDQVVYDFEQLYCASNLVSLDHKRLFFKRDNDRLRLVAEDITEQATAPFVNRSIEQFVNSWLSSWNAGNVDAYVGHYGNDFTDERGRDLLAWTLYKKGIFQERPNQRITIENLQISPIQGNQYQIRFKQDYRSQSYADLGMKTLIIRGCPGEYQIMAERWSAL
ncbi:L,D-transpeptidase family protein [Balneatrix alpica]|uniref:Murein L,D-transpeptidase family protein n=1 Tax=Balneatrix alpica TaxID=75684 RepID=A0ABV5ZFV4_9GAMM|nr:L,D-transpeptidase family protein [Balneatrix alpica]